MSKVQCIYPGHDEYDDLPEGYDEWRTSEDCTHLYCSEAAMYLAQWNAQRGQRESIANTREAIDSNETGPDLTDEEMAQVQWRLK